MYNAHILYNIYISLVSSIYPASKMTDYFNYTKPYLQAVSLLTGTLVGKTVFFKLTSCWSLCVWSLWLLSPFTPPQETQSLIQGNSVCLRGPPKLQPSVPTRCLERCNPRPGPIQTWEWLSTAGHGGCHPYPNVLIESRMAPVLNPSDLTHAWFHQGTPRMEFQKHQLDLVVTLR